ncbi:MAG: PAS domain-containing protein, partial [Gammaproteobacteria bacterium]|nr:PAS domain-containing protein [Gammaproteobacteria bacterium]
MLNQQSINSYSTSQQGTPDAWYRLRLFNYFRSSLALFFITIFVNGWLFELIPSRFLYAELFIIISVVYFIASLFFITGMIRRKPGLDTQVIIHTLVDISCIIVLMHATGGIRTGLGMLLLISISMTSLFLPKRLTILFAAISTLAIISEQIYSQFVYTDYSPAFTQAGLLGILIFITATLSAYTAKRLKESEKAAEYASHELETIVQMNEHIIHNMRTGIIVIKNDGLILMTNNAALELLGKPSIPPRSNLQDVSADLFNRFTDWNT